MATKFKLNHAGMAALLKSSEIRGALKPYADRILSAAQADPHDDTGDYERGLTRESVTTDRAVERVVATDSKSAIVEARFGVLARALDSA